MHDNDKTEGGCRSAGQCPSCQEGRQEAVQIELS